MSAGEHYDYATRGSEVSRDSHLDYLYRHLDASPAMEALGRDLVQGLREQGLFADVLDEEIERTEKNAHRQWSNIEGGRDRQRSMFEAAERCEGVPRVHELIASTANLDDLERVAAATEAPAWMTTGLELLRKAHEAITEKARKSGKPLRHRRVKFADISKEGAFDALSWLDAQIENGSRLVEFKQGRTGRSHYRFVLELPEGMNPTDHFAILEAFCSELAAEGWMVAGAIHQPDPTSDRRNVHAHVDGYDRPATWLTDHGCWDFEYVVRKNGKDTRPLKQHKVRYVARDADGKPTGAKVDTARLMRERFIGIVNNVIAGRPEFDPYVAGTYRDNAIDLTPLHHAGNRVIAREARGGSTLVGEKNATIILDDNLRAYQRRAEHRTAELEIDLQKFSDDGGDQHSIDELRVAREKLIRLQLQQELIGELTAASRSRADTILRTTSTDTRRRPMERAEDA